MRLPGASLLLYRLSEFPVDLKNLFCICSLASSRQIKLSVTGPEPRKSHCDKPTDQDLAIGAISPNSAILAFLASEYFQ